MKCIGFGKHENKCQNQAGGRLKPTSSHWCDRCEGLRRKTITKQMEAMLRPGNHKRPVAILPRSHL